jgi:hypothetical protein
MSKEQEQDPNVEVINIPEYEQLFSKERDDWKEEIRVLSVRMKNIRELGEVQVELYSKRQILLEYIGKLGQIMTKLNSKYRQTKGKQLKYYSEQHQYKYGANEKTSLIEGDLSEIKERVDLMNNQISFLNETIKTVDHMLYGIRHRILLEDYMRSGTVRRD